MRGEEHFLQLQRCQLLLQKWETICRKNSLESH